MTRMRVDLPASRNQPVRSVQLLQVLYPRGSTHLHRFGAMESAEPSIISLLCGTADSERSPARTSAPMIPDVVTTVLRFLTIRDIGSVCRRGHRNRPT